MVDETPTFQPLEANIATYHSLTATRVANVPQACAGKACGPSMPSMAVFMACDDGNHGKAVAELDDQHENWWEIKGQRKSRATLWYAHQTEHEHECN